MILATSNIDINNLNDIVTEAWINKLDQVYQRAKLTLNYKPEFEQIESIYNSKKDSIKNKIDADKKKERKFWIGWAIAFAIIMLLLAAMS